MRQSYKHYALLSLLVMGTEHSLAGHMSPPVLMADVCDLTFAEPKVQLLQPEHLFIAPTGSHEAAVYGGQHLKDAQPTRVYLTYLFDGLHQAAKEQDLSKQRSVIESSSFYLSSYYLGESRFLQHPDLMTSVMNAGFLYALGDYPGAYDLELKAWELAKGTSPHIQSVLAGNLCSEARLIAMQTRGADRQRYLAEAVTWGRLSYQVDANFVGRIELAMALDDSQDPTSADQVLRDVLGQADFVANNAAAKIIKSERDLLRRTYLPSVRALILKMDNQLRTRPQSLVAP